MIKQAVGVVALVAVILLWEVPRYIVSGREGSAVTDKIMDWMDR